MKKVLFLIPLLIGTAMTLVSTELRSMVIAMVANCLIHTDTQLNEKGECPKCNAQQK